MAGSIVPLLRDIESLNLRLQTVTGIRDKGYVSLDPAFTGIWVPFLHRSVSNFEPGENQMEVPLKSDLLEVLE